MDMKVVQVHALLQSCAKTTLRWQLRWIGKYRHGAISTPSMSSDPCIDPQMLFWSFLHVGSNARLGRRQQMYICISPWALKPTLARQGL